MYTIRVEKPTTIGDVIERVFGKVDRAQLSRAKEALLSANPHLAHLRSLPAGSVIRVPQVPGARTDEAQPVQGPGDASLELARKGLKAFLGELTLSTDEEIKTVRMAQKYAAEMSSLRPTLPDFARSLEKRIALRGRAAEKSALATKQAIATLLKDLDRLAALRRSR